MKPVAWIKIRELTYMQAVEKLGMTEWKTNLGLVPEPDDEGLYTETQVQKMRESFEQSVTDPENQPSQYGTVPMKEWVGLTDEDIDLYAFDEGVTDNKAPAWLVTYARGIESILKERNT
jgi:hypothetical protein